MGDVTSGLKSINELLDFNYLIPSYQRGYRWTKQQVKDLINDIWDFAQTNNTDRQYYCLQPIVVSRQEEKLYSIIDGQQRLTTILIILTVLRDPLKLLFPKKNLFELTYETRPNSGQFLKNIDVNLGDRNIDYYHICEAKSAVEEWFSKHEDARGDFISTLMRPKTPNVQVIWYEPESGVNPIEVFTRLNMGKIELTNSELIKALFLSSSYSMTEPELRQFGRKQDEISAEWDRYEHNLRNEEFWGFLQNGVVIYTNHIELIFDLIAGNIKSDGSRKSLDGQETFRYFALKIKDGSSAWQIWENEVKVKYQLLHDWFSDKRLYHLMGFLISCGVPLSDLINRAQNLTKHSLFDFIREQINSQIPKNIDELTYQERKGDLRKVLLLFNVLSILENTNTNTRFQFNRYKGTERIKGWDIEHIHSVKSEMPGSVAHQLDWLREIRDYEENETIKEEINSYLTSTPQDRKPFEEMYNKIWNIYSESVSEKSSERDVNDISNLTLLDSGTNRGYKNALFPIKRKIIIEKDQSGTFIPLCTKNVFLKYYSPIVSQSTFWGKKDREHYKNKLHQVIGNYLSGNNYDN